MSIRFEPEEMSSVEKRGEDTWFCSMCTCKFDRASFEDAAGCPGCHDMAEAQKRRNQAGLKGGL